MMEASTFGERLRLAFGNAKNAEIARQIGVAPSTMVNYLAGRIPDLEKLILIKTLTKCDLDWLLTGDNSRNVNKVRLSRGLRERLEMIAAEQASVVYGDVDLAGGNLDARTLDLLTEYLLSRALRSVNLIASEKEIMSAPDVKRAQRFTFVANLPQSMDDRIRELIENEVGGKSVSPLAQEDEIRDMIRAIVREEISHSRKRPVFPLDLTKVSDDDEEEAPRRKAG